MKTRDVGGTYPMLDSTRMCDFLTNAMNLKWKNGTEHELQVMDLLDQMGIVYVYQPNGSQAFPDFEIPSRWGTIKLECKPSQGAAPMYNSGRPHADGLYIFTSKNSLPKVKGIEDTTIFFGDDVLTLEKREIYDRMLLEMKDVLLRYQAKPEWQDSRGFDFYLREMYTQSGGAEYTNYFTHKDRKQCEQNVFNFFK